MNPNDPNVALIETVAAAIGTLTERLVFVGGCAAGLLITDPAQPPVRPTNDVDGVVEAASLVEFYAIEREFEALGLSRDSSDGAPICAKLGNAVVGRYVPARQHVLKLRLSNLRKAVRLGKCQLLALEEHHGELQPELGFAHSSRQENVVRDHHAHRPQ